ncbi:cyclase family protein [Alicyclobacillus shizuokensis]|uniref:cyclase family protein n=1 Tax=Alicyclobacillus shizuokensis TaxID=392014 RepID=UPI00082DA7B0|nr:cyclase family protein [Alicyclobacillus shizuokensis]MCL6627415.1 cyclase family protein [Alicyclobacillus shizuokensis]
MLIIDLSQEIFSGSPVYRGHQPTVVHRLKSVQQLPNGQWTFAINALFLSDHCATHTDSFQHMDPSPKAKAIHELPLEMFQGLAVCLDVSVAKPAEFITVAMLEEAAERARVEFSGPFSPKVVLLYTGHYGRTFPKPAYGHAHPGLDRAATEWLADRGVINIGIDCASVDVEPHKGDEWKPAHTVCRERGILNTENLGDLSQVAGRQFWYMGLPLKITGGTAGPTRAAAILLEEEDLETCRYLISLT